MKEILEKIKPKPEEVKKFKSVTSEFIKKIKLKDARAILGGSGVKNTWLSGSYDVDIFVQFNYSKFAKQSGELSGFLEKSLKKSFKKINRLHGSRDYFRINYKGLNFEIVPILKITKSSQAVNITDVSPLHSAWVNEHAKALKDDIRLLKQFCKANGIYGAESYINGFSGYVLEILTAYYGSFANVLKSSQKWGIKEVIDPSRFYKKNEVLFNINKSKLLSPLIVVDPVDKARNAAAALSEEKFLKFISLANKFLKSPDSKFFMKEEISLEKLKQTEQLKKAKHNLVFLNLTPLKGKEDVIGAKLLKAYNYLKEKLADFEVVDSNWDWDKGSKAVAYFILAKKELPKFEVKQGPPVKFKESVERFKEKNKSTFFDKGRIMAKVEVKHSKLEDFVRQLLEEEYIIEKVKEIKVSYV